MTSPELPLVSPDFGAVGGSSQLSFNRRCTATYDVTTSVLMTIVRAATRAIGSSSRSWHTARERRTGLFVVLGGAAITGGAIARANWLLDVGATL